MTRTIEIFFGMVVGLGFLAAALFTTTQLPLEVRTHYLEAAAD